MEEITLLILPIVSLTTFTKQNLMKKSKIAISVLAIFIFINVNIYAQTKHEKFLYFSGNIKDVKKREITLLSVGYNIQDGFSELESKKVFQTKVDENGDFSFAIPDLGKIMPLIFNFCGKSDRTGLIEFTGIKGSYFTEPGDNVKITVRTGDQDTISFTGKGSEKYNLIEKIENEFWTSYFRSALKKIKIKEFEDSLQLHSKLVQYSNCVKQFEVRKDSMIKASKVLNPDVKKLIRYEFGGYFEDWQFRLLDVLYNQYPAYRQQIVSYYNLNKDIFFNPPSALSVLCSRYMSNLVFRIRMGTLISENTEKVDLVSYFNSLKNSYSGILKERLLAHFVFGNMSLRAVAPYSSKTLDSLVLEVSNLVKTPYIKEAITENLRRQSGTKVFASTFNSLNGDKVNIESLKGKAVLLDVWFLGCTACAKFHKEFEKSIYPLIKNDTNLVILSLNIDRKKENWLKGIQSNLYTSSDYLNVTTGNGLEHPFIKYYNIKGGPFLMLIDRKGNLHSRITTRQVLDAKSFLKIVNEASYDNVVNVQ